MPADLVDRHLEDCAPCRAFATGAATVRRRVAVRPAEAVPDLTDAIVAAARTGGYRPVPAPVAARAGGAHWSRWALLGVALVQLALAVPPMVLGHDATVPVHAARELGGWYMALSAALVLVVLRPDRAPGLLPFAATLAVVMTGTAVVDVVSGRTAALAESQHLIELVGVLLLWTIARRPLDREPLLGGLGRFRASFAS